MKSFSILLTAIAIFAGSSLANAQGKGGVAIVDIDAVAKELGISDAVVAKLQAASTQLNQDLNNAKGQLQGKMNQAEAQVGQQANAQGRQQLVDFNRQLNQQYDQYVAQARQAITNTRVQEIRAFQEKLKPVALAAAKAKGFDVVMMKVSPPVFVFSDEADITQEVIAAAKKAGIKPETAAAAPAAASEAPAPAAGEKGNGNAKAKADKKG
ncbi:OmpH family outer membrane protein [bacterium]|nr:OmpH family outer membrane protein [bacterium]